MATCTGYFPNLDNTTWREIGDSQNVGKGTHAEIGVLNTMRKKGALPGVLLFVQDQAPCKDCHKKFLDETANFSSIFIIMDSGYEIQKGVTTPIYDGNENITNQVIVLNSEAKLDKDELPIALYYHNGTAFLGAPQTNFPVHPGIAQFLVKKQN